MALNEVVKELSRFNNSAIDIVDPTQKHIDSGREAALYCGEGGGGGICLLLNQVPDRALASIVFFRSMFEKNEAINGGRQLGMATCPPREFGIATEGRKTGT